MLSMKQVIGIILGVLGLVGLYLLTCILYTQNPGEASVIVSFTGQVEGVNYEQGLQTKNPLSNRVVYDIRNNTLSYIGQSGSDNKGGDSSGPQITFQDADGVTGNIDLTVRYSIRGNSVKEIYNEYKTQPEFIQATLANDVRSDTRAVASKYRTLDLFGNRDKIKSELFNRLKEKWDKIGVDIEEVYLQEVRYSKEVTTSFDQAQNARTKVESAKADQERAKIEAETNKIKSQALSDSILKEKLIDALRHGSGTYIIDTNNISVSTGK